MAFRWIVNAGLLAIPIGTTIGVLVGIDAQRQASGQEPLFAPGNGGYSNPGVGGGGGSGSDGGNHGGSGNPKDNRITPHNYCQKSYGIEPPTIGEKYILNPNQWGVTDGESGALCMNVLTFNNGSYPTNTTAPEFSVTWQYDPGPETQPVHAFPNIMVDSGVLPLAVQSVQQINLDFAWTYGVGDTPAAKTDASELTAQSVNTNVAIDMFLDSDKTNSQNSSAAKYEIMIWFADFGSTAQPIGLQKGAVASKVLDGTTFNLYYGQNGQDQNVLTWVTSQTTENFTGDISPLLSRPTEVSASDYPTDVDYLGHLSLGSEAFSANTNVTFHVSTLSIDIRT